MVESSSCHVVRGYRRADTPARCLVPVYRDVNGPPTGTGVFRGAGGPPPHFLWQWHHAPGAPPLLLPARWCRRERDVAPIPGAVVILATNALHYCREDGRPAPAPVRAEVLGGRALVARLRALAPRIVAESRG